VLQFKILSSLFVAASILMMVSSSPKVLAAVISCVPSVPCDGTNDNDIMDGSNQGDNMRGFDGDDTMYGGKGNDTLHAYLGNDRMFGRAGNDELRASYDDDFLSGQDVLTLS